MLIHTNYTNEGAAVLKALLQGSHGFCLGPRYRNTEHRRYAQKKKGDSQRGSGNRVPSHLNESPFLRNIADSARGVKFLRLHTTACFVK